MGQIAENPTELQSRTILIIDDEPANLAVVAKYLTDRGFQVIVAQNGEAGLELSRQDQPDLILLDVLLLGIDGFEVCRRLKADERTREIPVIFMTVLASMEDKVKGFEVGGVDYISKPFQEQEVLARISTHLRLRELNEHLEQQVRQRTRELSKVNQAYKALSDCNQALLRATDEGELLQDVCRIIVEDCGYLLVWIGFAEYDQAKTVRPVAQTGYEKGYLDTLKFTWADTKLGRGPTGTAIREKRPVINKDVLTNPDFAPWRAEAIKRGYASSAALPLLTSEQEVIGALNVYASEPEAFTTEEVNLLLQLASDLAYGIVSLRLQAEHERADRALAQSESKLRSTLQSMDDLVFVFDKETRFTDYYAPGETLVMPPATFIGKKHAEVMPPEMNEPFSKAFNENREGRVAEFEYRLEVDGEIKWYAAKLSPMLLEDEFAGSVAITRNISERKRMEQQRQAHIHFLESLERVNQAILQSNEMEKMLMTVLETMISIFDCDRAWLLYPCDPDASSWHVPMEVTQPEYPGAFTINAEVPMTPDVAETFRALLDTDETVSGVLDPGEPHWDPQDQYGVRSFLSIAIRTKVGKPWDLGLHQCTHARIWTNEEQKLFKEISQRIGDALGTLLTLRDLHESEERFQAIADYTYDWESWFGPDGQLRWINPAVERLTGFSTSECLGMSDYPLPLIHPQDQEMLAKIMTDAKNGSSGNDVPFRIQQKSGAVVWAAVSWQPIFDTQGKSMGLRTSVRDITERKQAEEEIRKLNQELEQRVLDRTAQLEAANKELEAFAYSISHDLRAPLRHIDGFMELLREKTATKLDEQSQHYMTNISDAANRMGNLIDNLLSFSRMGRQAMSKAQVDIGLLVREVIEELEPEAEGRNINWHIADIPAVMGERAMLRVVLVNLISNALKFTRPRQQAEIEIGCILDSNAEVKIFVRDNGVGFDMDYVDKLFGVFQRLHRDDEYEGTGIGLANVRRIIGRHGGRTWAEGEVDHGATFYFSLPTSIQET